MKTDENIVKLEFIKPSTESNIKLHLVEATISAGFPSPADDYSEARIDLNRLGCGYVHH